MEFHSIVISSLWSNGGEAVLTLKNSGLEELIDWAFILQSSSELNSINFYNFTCMEKKKNIYIIKPATWATAIKPGASISSGFGFTYTGAMPTFIPIKDVVEKTTPKQEPTHEQKTDMKYDGWIEPPYKKNAVYYHTNWATYGRDFQVCDLPIDYIPTIAYAFYNIRADGVIFTGDIYADIDKVFTTRSVNPPDSWSDGLDYHGNFGQFLKLKKAGKKFNLVLSVGGWTWSSNFSDAVSTTTSRTNMVNSLLDIFNKYPIFAGVNIDWEYLSNDGVNYGNLGNKASPNDADNFISFVDLLRSRLDADNKKSYKISLACSADPKKLKFPVKKLNEILDEFHIMTYDFSSGNWGDVIATHHTNLYPASYTPFSTSAAVDAYISAGAAPEKILIGAAFYSRGFANTEGLGKAASGGSPDMSWEQGVCDYKTLPRPGAVEVWDDICKAEYSYDASKKILNSYDTIRSIQEKCKYINEKKLGGIIVWETSGDVKINNRLSLTKAIYEGLYNQAPSENPKPDPLFRSKTFQINCEKVRIIELPKKGFINIDIINKVFEYISYEASADIFRYMDVSLNKIYTINVPEK